LTATSGAQGGRIQIICVLGKGRRTRDLSFGCKTALALDRTYRGSPVPVTGRAAAPQLTELRGLGAVARKREPLYLLAPATAIDLWLGTGCCTTRSPHRAS